RRARRGRPAGPRGGARASGPAGGAVPEGYGASGPLAVFLLGFDLLKRYPVMVTPPLIGMGAVFAVGVLLFGSAMGLFAVGGVVGQRPGRTGAIVGVAVPLLAFFGIVTLGHLVSSAVGCAL